MRKLKLTTLIPALLLLIGSISCLIPGVAYAEEEEPTEPAHFRGVGTGSDVKVEASKAAKEVNKYRNGDNSTPEDDKNRLTAQVNPASDAVPYVDWAHCAADSQDPDVPDYLRVAVCAYPPPEPGEDTNPERLPSTREILLSAANLIHADGAGLHKRPDGVSYTNKYIPTLVAATHPTQTHTVTLLGHDITITLTATSYTWSWGDGTPDLTTTSPGMPWQEGMDPNTDPALIRHYYKAPNGWKSFLDGPYPYATRTITLTTTWAGTATNPFTGETQTINGLVTTTETTGPFPLGQLIVNNTDTSEEKQGH